MKFKIFYSTKPTFGILGLNEPSELVELGTIECEKLSMVFELMQDEHPLSDQAEALGLHNSMSVGDAIQDDLGHMYLISSKGIVPLFERENSFLINGKIYQMAFF